MVGVILEDFLDMEEVKEFEKILKYHGNYRVRLISKENNFRLSIKK